MTSRRLGERVVAALLAAERTCAVAESLTGGLVLDALVAVPGASRCLRGGVVAYQTDVKRDLLGVDRELLAREGAVHPDVAAQMATGVRDLLRADLGVATTGVAGPDPQNGQAPGTVHVAVAGSAAVRVTSLTPDDVGGPGAGREATRAAARDAALRLVLLALEDEEVPSPGRPTGHGLGPGGAPGAAGRVLPDG